MSPSSLGKRLQKHMIGAGLYEGESNHGYRRGRMQQCAADGMDKDSISALAQIKTAAITDRHLDAIRHEGRLAKTKKRPYAVMQSLS